MEKIFSIEKAAKAAGTTAETLRHYDRIGLVKPCKTDEWTGYRYYSERELVRLNTVRALRCMDLSLKEIKEILELDDFEKIISLLKQAERKADQKMKELTDAKCKIQRARQFYEEKRTNQAQRESAFVQTFPERVILLSDRLTEPTLDNLWDYHRHFYAQVGEEKKKDFSFEDLAGIYESEGRAHLFALCTRFTPAEGLLFLPQGDYLCLDCTEKTRRAAIEEMKRTAEAEYAVTPQFILSIVVISGILQWNYQVQIYIGKSENVKTDCPAPSSR